MEFLTFLNTAGQEFTRFSSAMLIQSSILIVVLLLLDLLLRKQVRAVFRYYLWMLILVKLVLPTTLTLPTGVGYWVGDKIAAGPVTIPMAVQREEKNLMGQGPSYTEMKTPEPVGPKAVSAVQTPPVSAVTQTPITWQAVLLLGWGFAVIVMTLLMVQRYFFVKGLIAQAGPAGDSLAALLQDCGRKMGMARLPVVKVSPAMVSPAACGLVNPVILIPEFLPSKLTEPELRGVLLHELAHIRRGDLWVNLFQTILQVLYFYNPLLWLANTIIRRVREQAVDETVMANILDFRFWILDLKKEERPDIGNIYAQTLVNVARVATLRPALSLRMIGVVESKSALTGRIKHILNRPIPKTAKLGVLGLAGIFLIGVVLLPMACGKVKKESPIEPVQPVSKTTLPNGITVELLGVSEHPSKGKKWWRPDGSPLSEAPYEKIGGTVYASSKESNLREVAVRIENPKNIDYRYTCNIIPGGSSAGGNTQDKNGEKLKNIEGTAFEIPPGVKTITVAIGIASGSWKTQAHTYNTNNISAIGTAVGGVAFSEAYEANGTLVITVSDDIKDSDYRIVAIDRTGKLHISGNSPSVGAGNMRQTTARFSGLPLKQIKEFQFQTRPYEWIKFKNVSLEPGQKTPVEIETSKGHVFVIRGTRIYHAKGCPTLKDVPQEQFTEFSSSSDAEKQGLKVCRYCQVSLDNADPKNSTEQKMAGGIYSAALNPTSPQTNSSQKWAWDVAFEMGAYPTLGPDQLFAAMKADIFDIKWNYQNGPFSNLTLRNPDPTREARRSFTWVLKITDRQKTLLLDSKICFADFTGHDAETVEVEATIFVRSKSTKAAAENFAGKIQIELVPDGSNVRLGDHFLQFKTEDIAVAGVMYKIKVPRRFQVDARTSGRIDVVGIDGGFRFTGTGQVIIDQVKGPIDIRNSNGKVLLGNIEGPESIDITLNNGSMALFNASAPLTIKNLNGGIYLDLRQAIPTGMETMIDNGQLNIVMASEGFSNKTFTIKSNRGMYWHRTDGSCDLTSLPLSYGEGGKTLSVGTVKGKVHLWEPPTPKKSPTPPTENWNLNEADHKTETSNPAGAKRVKENHLPEKQPQPSEQETHAKALEAAEVWLRLVDEGKYTESWDQAASFFQNALTKADWEKSLKAVRPALGKVVSRKILSKTYATTLPGAPDGEYVVIQFETSFENKKSSIETVTPMKEKDGTWKVSGYYLK